MIVQIFGILIMVCIGIMFGKYWFRKLEDVEKASFDEGYKTALSEMTKNEYQEKEISEVDSPFNCFSTGRGEKFIIIQYRDSGSSSRYVMNSERAEKLSQQLLTAIQEIK